MRNNNGIFLIIVAFLCILNGCGNTEKGFRKTHEINLITREPGSGTRDAFKTIFSLEQKSANGGSKDLISKEAVTENNTNAILTSVAGDFHAIGYLSIGSLSDKVKVVSVDGVMPSKQAIRTGQYKVFRPFVMVSSDKTNKLTADFIAFVLSQRGQEIAEQTYVAIADNAKEYQSTQPTGAITIGGSSSVSPLMEMLIEEYQMVNPNAEIALQISDSTTGITKTMEHVYDIGISSRSLSASEKEDLQEIQIALDGIAIIVNKENQISNFSSKQIQQMYLGRTKTWEEIEQEK